MGKPIMNHLNVDELLLPIEGDNICGRNLKYDRIYDQIREFRREDDHSLSQGIWQVEPKKASWKDVIKMCVHALTIETKDLQIAVWLTEALTATKGFQGLNDGILLLTGLCEKFWNEIYPQIEWENRDTIARVAPFFFFNEKIQEKILQIPLTSPIDGVSNIFTLSDWMMTRHNIRVKNSKGTSVKELKKSAMSTSMDFLKQIESDVNCVVANLKTLDEVLEKLCANEGPSFRKIYDHLNDILQINTTNIADNKTQSKKEVHLDNSNADIEKDHTNDNDSPQPNKKPSNATIDQAYEALNEIAVFLEEQQPQSPVSILLKIANSIGKKTFQELLEINMQNGVSVMNTISELYKVLR